MAKYTIDLGPDIERQLNQVAKDKAATKADIIRRAVSAYVVISNEVAKGNKIVVNTPDDRVLKELVSH